MHLEEVDDEVRVVVKVVLDGLVEDVDSGALDRDVLEADVLPRDRVVRHHHLQRVVEFVVLHHTPNACYGALPHVQHTPPSWLLVQRVPRNCVADMGRTFWGLRHYWARAQCHARCVGK